MFAIFRPGLDTFLAMMFIKCTVLSDNNKLVVSTISSIIEKRYPKGKYSQIWHFSWVNILDRKSKST